MDFYKSITQMVACRN